jgi:hypothetical protein
MAKPSTPRPPSSFGPLGLPPVKPGGGGGFQGPAGLPTGKPPAKPFHDQALQGPPPTNGKPVGQR